MLLRNWIRSGVRYIKDLSFVNGIVDRRVCNATVDKRNILNILVLGKLCYHMQMISFELRIKIRTQHMNIKC